MSVIYKKTLRISPLSPSDPGKYYPQLITLGQKMTIEKIIYEMKEKSSLSAGDIESVTRNFVEIITRSLLTGYSVLIPKLGLFSLSAKSEGTETEKDCTANKIKSVHVNFRPAKNLRPNLNATRAEDQIEFIDLVTYMKKLSLTGIDLSELGVTGNGGTGGTGGTGGDDGDDEYIDPNA